MTRLLPLLLLLASPTFASEKILFIGDSHSVGVFGVTLDTLLRKENTVYTYAVCGARSSYWYSSQKATCGIFEKDLNGKILNQTGNPKVDTNESKLTPDFSKLLSSVKPTVVVIALGTNYSLAIGNKTQEAIAITEIKKMAEDASENSKCYWVANPKTRRFANVEAQVDQLIETAVGTKCKVIHSLPMIKAFPAETAECHDSIHYNCGVGLKLAADWAGQVYKKLEIK